MSLKSPNATAQNALENEQRFVLDTKEGLYTFYEFIVSEEEQIDALDPDLEIEDLALPENVAASLTQLRFEYKELVRLTKEGLHVETGELPENIVITIVDQYQQYIGADERFSRVYVAYEASLENQQLNKIDTLTVEQKSAQLTPQKTDSVSEHEPTTAQKNLETQAEEVDYVASEESDSLSVEQQLDIQSAPLKVFGMSLPHTGPEGVVIARSLRDRLEIMKHNHPELKDNPKNLTITDAIIRVLFVIPAAGLSEEQVTQVSQLARKLSGTENEVVRKDGARDEENELPESEQDESGGSIQATNVSIDEDVDWTASEKTKKHGAMKVEVDSADDGDVEIFFAKKVAQQAEKEIDLTDESVVSAIDQLTQSVQGSSVVAEMEKQDSINNSIPAQVVRDSVKREAVSDNSLTGMYLVSNPQYQRVFQENNLSPAAFEKQLQTTIKSIDAKEIDFWEAKFDEPYTSAFSFLQEMTLQQINDLNALPPKERKKLLQDENVKYEAYLTWMDTYEYIAQVITLSPTTKFSELYTIGMMQIEMAHYQESASASQFTL